MRLCFNSTIQPIGRLFVLILNGMSVGAALTLGIAGHDHSEELVRNHVAAAYCSIMSACVCTYFFQWGKISEWVDGEGVLFVSAFCATTSLVPSILCLQLTVSFVKTDFMRDFWLATSSGRYCTFLCRNIENTSASLFRIHSDMSYLLIYCCTRCNLIFSLELK